MSFASQPPTALTHEAHPPHDENDHSHQGAAGPRVTDDGDPPRPVDRLSLHHDHRIDSAYIAVYRDVYDSLPTAGEEIVGGERDAPSEIRTTATATLTFIGKRSATEAGICGGMTAASEPQSAKGARVATIVCSIPGCGRTCPPRIQFGQDTTNITEDDDVAVCCSVHKRDPTARAAKKCQIEGCQRVRSVGQYCTRHGKDPMAPIQNAPKGEPCKIPGCTRVVKRHGVCYRHYNLKDSDPTTLQTMELSVARPIQAYVDNPQLWDTLFQQLQNFVATNGHFQIPLGRADLFEMSQFVDSMRLAHAVLDNRNRNGHTKSAFEVSTIAFVDDSIEGPIVHDGTDPAAMATATRAGGESIVSTEEASSIPSPASRLSQASTVLTPDRIAKLNSIGFPWQWSNRHIGNVIQSSTAGGPCGQQELTAACSGVSLTSWEARYKELLDFHQRHGHYKVSRHSDFALWSWCKSQRQKYKQTMEAIRVGSNVRLGQRRNHGGNKSQSVQSSSNDGEGLQGNNGVHESSARISTAPSASVWKMSAERIVRLQAINFEWDVQALEYDTSWNHRYVDLLKYKAVHGNCRVPKTHENKELSQWVKQMRRHYALKTDDGNGAPSTFTNDRIRQLEEIGFEWRLK